MARIFTVACVVALLIADFGDSTLAGVISVEGDTGDGQVDINGEVPTADLTREIVRVGAGGNQIRGHAIILFFELPLLPSYAQITNAEISIQYFGITEATVITPPNFNVDLFGIDARPTATIEGSDYYDGNAAFSSDSLIQASVLVPSSSQGKIGIANSILLNFVTSLYSGGTPSDVFATFRLNPDLDLPVTSPPIRGYEIGMGDNS